MTGFKLNGKVAKVGNINIQAIEVPQVEEGFVVVGKKAVTKTGDAVIKAQAVKPMQNQYDLKNVVPLIQLKNIPAKKGNNFAISPLQAKLFNPIRLKGISDQRPEIVALTDYQPYYDNDEGFEFSDYGVFVNTSISSRILRFENIRQLFETLDKTEDAKKIIDEIAKEYVQEIDSARSEVHFMTRISEIIRKSKQVFDIRKDIHLEGFSISNQIVSLDSYRDFLIGQYGFSEDGVDNFSNTKMFGQFLFDIRNTLRQYSPSLFGANLAPNVNMFNENLNFGLGEEENVARNADRDFGRYNTKNIDITDGKFQFKIELLSNLNVPILGSYFNQFLDILPEEPELKIKLLTILLSKEAGISSGLADKNISNIILNTFDGKDVGDPFDSIIGIPGDRITDQVNNDKSLMSLLRFEIDNEIVLPFEGQYVRDSSEKLYTPGSVKFIDSILQGKKPFTFTQFSNYQNRFSKIAGDALAAIEGLLATKDNSKKLKPIHLYDEIINDFVESGELLLKSKTKSENNVIIYSGAWAEAAIIKAAASNREIKQLLFQYVLCLGFIGKPGNSQFGDNSVTNFFHRMSKTEIKRYRDLPAIKQNKELSKSINSLLRNTLIEIGKSDEDPEDVPNNEVLSSKELGNTFTTDSQSGYTALAFLAETILEKINSVGNFNAVSVVHVNEFLRHLISVNDLVILNRIGDFISSIHEKAGPEAYEDNKTRFNRLNYSTMAIMAFEIYMSFIEKFFIGVSELTKNAKVINLSVNAGQFEQFMKELKAKTKYSTNNNNIGVSNVSIADVRKKIIDEQINIFKIVKRLRTTIENINSAHSDVSNFFDPDGEGNWSRLNKLLDGVGGKERIALINEAQFILARKALNDLDVGEGLTLGEKIVYKPGKTINLGGVKFTVPIIGKEQKPAFLDRSIISPNETKLIQLLFNLPAFRKTKGENLKILSVGIPAGFSNNFQNEVGINEKNFDSINQKEKDVIQVNVYRKNIEFEDVVFFPKPYLFEMSRFVSRASLDESEISANISNLEGLAGLGISFMKDFSYSGNEKPVNLASFITNEDYSFLSKDQKTSLVFNHLLSYIFELYIKLTTGMSLDESDYLVNDSLLEGHFSDSVKERFKDLITVYVSNLSGQPLTIDQLKKSSPQLKNLLDKIDTFSLETNFTEQITPPVLPGVSRSAAIEITEDLVNFLKLYSPKSLLTGGKSQGERITSPKIFERIFNLSVDPDDFEIDIKSTLETESGKKTYAVLAERGLLETPKKLKPRPKDRSIQFEQFFVTISTVGSK